MSSGHLGLEADEGLWACGCGPRVCVEGCRGGAGGRGGKQTKAANLRNVSRREQ